MKTQSFVFVSSPDAVTPYHFDPEHNILMQLAGEKAMTVFPAGNADCAPDRVHEAYHTGGGRELTWRDDLACHGMTFRLTPAKLHALRQVIDRLIEVSGPFLTQCGALTGT